MRYSLFALAAMTMLVSPGCRHRTAAATGTGAASTPAQTVENLHRAMAQGDVPAAMSCFRTQDAKNPAILASFEFTAAGVDFHDRFVEVYGKKAWEKFNGDGGFTISLPKPSKAEDFTVQIEGDRALCYAPNETEPGVLIRENDKWYASPDTLVPTGDPAQDLTRRMTALAKMLRMYTKKLDRSIDPDGLDQEMGIQVYQVITQN